MESYLMMLYVTLEQETALKSFFVDQGWTFCKPDLSVTTDKLGPAVINAQPLDRESGNVTCINGKRKARTVPESAPKVKLVKVLTGTTAAQTETENLWRKSNEKHIKGVSVISNKVTEINQFDSITATDPSESEDNENVIIKVEKNVGNSQEDDIQDYETEDVGDEDNDDTDIDDGMEVIEETSEEIVDEFGLNTKRNNDTGETSHRMKVVFGETTDEKFVKNDNDKVDFGALAGDSKTRFTCEICGRGYLSKHTLQRHLKKHSSPFYCMSCSVAFDKAVEKKEHDKEKHSQYFSCPKCGKDFKRKNSLSVHMESVHIGVQRFPCTWPDCEKSFFRQDVLRDHIYTHTGERPYICQKCHKSYSSKSSLNHHWKACKTDGLACNICGQVLSSRSGLADHMQGMHNKIPLSCVCGQVFIWRNNLLKHKKNCALFHHSTESKLCR